MLSFLRKKISSEEMALYLYLLLLDKDTVENPKKDKDGTLILSVDEQKLLLLSHLCELLDSRGLVEVKAKILVVFADDNRSTENEEDLMTEALTILHSVEKIQKFFEQIPEKDHEFFKNDFPFDRKLNPIQKFIVLRWYVEYTKATDLVFVSFFKKYRLKESE